MLVTKLGKRTKGLGPQLLMFLWFFWSRSIELSWGFLVLCPLLLAVSHSSSYLSYGLQPAFCSEHLEPPKLAKKPPSWWDGAAGLYDPDLVQNTCALQDGAPEVWQGLRNSQDQHYVSSQMVNFFSTVN